MNISEFLPTLEQLAPLAYAEDFDNVGLLVGSYDQEITGILVCHDALEEVIDEAIAKGCNFVLCFHPILFSGLKKINGKNYVERAVIKAIRHDIAIYAIHTALDNHKEGVNTILCDALGIINSQVLIPKAKFIQKLVTYVPQESLERVKGALFEAGAGSIGNYAQCSFVSQGTGSFMGNDQSSPVIGVKGSYQEVQEAKLEVIFEKHLRRNILSSLMKNHPYEEVSFEVYDLINDHQEIGMGRIGYLKQPLPEEEFLLMVKQNMKAGGIRHSKYINKTIHKVAVLGGSGSFAIQAAIAQGADAFITADLKYHQFYEAENKLLLADIGHYESERFTKNYIVEFLSKKLTNFAVILSTVNTNPVNYI